MHHALNEAWSLNRVTRASDVQLRWVRGASFAVHLVLYMLLIRFDRQVATETLRNTDLARHFPQKPATALPPVLPGIWMMYKEGQ